MRIYTLFKICVFGSFAGALLSGCATNAQGKRVPLYTPPLQTSADSSLHLRSITEIAILPLSAAPGRSVSVAAVDTLQPDLITAFEAQTSFRIVNNEDPERVWSVIESTLKEAVAPRQRAAQVGRLLGVDAVLFGEVSRLDQSDGGKFGAQRPSAVSFSLQLLDVDSKEIVWSAGYDRKDESLTDNLFRLPEIARDGMQFHSVEALARLGFQDAARDLEIKYRRIDEKNVASEPRVSSRSPFKGASVGR